MTLETKVILLGEWLLQKKFLTLSQLTLALEEQSLTGDFLGEILVRKKYIREEDLMRALSEQFNMPYLDLRHQYIDFDLALRFPSEIGRAHV